MTEEQREKRREISRRNYKNQSKEYKKARADKAYARIKERMATDPDFAARYKAKRRNYGKSYRAKHKREIAKRTADYRRRNPDKVKKWKSLERNKEYQKAYRERVKARKAADPDFARETQKKELAYRRRYRKHNREYFRIKSREDRARRKARMESDPEYAERQRRLKRIRDSRRDRDKVNEARRLHYAQNKEKCRAKQKAYRKRNANRINEYLHEYRSRPQVKAKIQEWRDTHKEEIKAYRKKYQQTHKRQISEKRRMDY